MNDRAFELDSVPPELRREMLEERRANSRGTVQRHRQRLKDAGYVGHNFMLPPEITEMVTRFQRSHGIRKRQVALQLLIARGLDAFDNQEEEKP